MTRALLSFKGGDFPGAPFIVLMSVWAARSQGSRRESPPLQGSKEHFVFLRASEGGLALGTSLTLGDLGEVVSAHVPSLGKPRGLLRFL